MEILGRCPVPDHMEILNCMRGRIARPVALCIGMVMANRLAAAPDQPIDEYQVKAAFIYNFAKFVEWPSQTFQNANEAMSICIPGQDPFGRSLLDTVAGRAIEGHPLVVRHVSGLKQVAGCQIVFIGSAESKRSLPALDQIRTPGVLTIGETDASVAAGVIVNFRLAGNKVHFDINLEAADRQKLRISSRLLSLAHIVDSNRK